MTWDVILVDEVDDWFMDLVSNDLKTAELVASAVDQLETDGPILGRPLVDSIEDSKIHNMKELRPGSTGRTEVRILFVFDPERQGGAAGGRRQGWPMATLVRGKHPASRATLPTMARRRVPHGED